IICPFSVPSPHTHILRPNTFPRSRGALFALIRVHSRPKNLFARLSYNDRMLTPTKKIWHNGRFINWNDAQIHVLSHGVSYGSSVFEGIRCYATSNGPSVFRLREHVRRMTDSGHIYRMDLPFTGEQIEEAILELVRVNGLPSCYIRPIAL